MERDDSVYLQHILDAIARIEEYLQDAGEEAFYRQYWFRELLLPLTAAWRQATGRRCLCFSRKSGIRECVRHRNAPYRRGSGWACTRVKADALAFIVAELLPARSPAWRVSLSSPLVQGGMTTTRLMLAILVTDLISITGLLFFCLPQSAALVGSGMLRS